jgi:ferrous iron transport protein A
MSKGDDRLADRFNNANSTEWQGFVYVSGAIANAHSRPGQSHRSHDRPEASRSANAMSLSMMQVGDRVRIASLNCGKFNNRLMGIGLIPGAVVQVVSCTSTGSVIIALQNQWLGLGAPMTRQIQVLDAKQQVAPVQIDPPQNPLG